VPSSGKQQRMSPGPAAKIKHGRSRCEGGLGKTGLNEPRGLRT
jgi:hypothetical protein